MNETAVSQHIILDAAQHSVDLWRNNSGGFDDEGGRFVRYGLGAFTKDNSSPAVIILASLPYS